MTTKTAQKRAGLMVQLVTGLTPSVETEVTALPGTRRRYKKRARKCACGCGRTVTPTPQAPHKRYFDDACRKRAARRKAAKQRPSAPASAPILELMTCQFCGSTFLATVGHGAKYCKPAHRTAAAECRRAAAIDAVTAILGGMGGTNLQDSVAFVEREGMRKVSRLLRQNGYLYDELAKVWRQLVTTGDTGEERGNGAFSGRRSGDRYSHQKTRDDHWSNPGS